MECAKSIYSTITTLAGYHYLSKSSLPKNALCKTLKSLWRELKQQSKHFLPVVF